MTTLNSFFSSLEANFFQMPIWKWALLLIFLILFPLARKTLELLLLKFKKNLPPILAKNKTMNYFIPFKIEKPFSWILALSLLFLTIDILDLQLQVRKYALLFCQILLALRVIQLVYICTDSLGLFLKESIFSDESENQIQVLPFLIKTFKIMVIVLGFLITLQNLGFNVVSLLAGLGLGGLAIALAAQETVSNLFGSVTILFDKPFQIGDQIKILDIEGAIEEIGFRSTRIRSANNTLVTIPNSIVAKEKIENLTNRYVRKSKQTLTLTYETPIDKIQKYIQVLEATLQQSNNVENDSIIVKFNNFSAASLDILINFDIKTTDYKASLTIQENLFFEFYKKAQELQVDFAYPTQKLFIKTT